MTPPREASLYDRVGGAAGVAALVDRFYERLRDDDAVRHQFPDDRMAGLIAGQNRYLGALLGGPEPYDGPDLAAAHAHLDITDDQVDAVIGHLEGALRDVGVPDALVEQVVVVVSRLWYARRW